MKNKLGKIWMQLVKNGDYKKVEDEIRALKSATGDKVLKVIIETSY